MRVLMLTCNNSLQDGINRHILAVAPAVNRLDGVEVAVCTTFCRGELHEALEREGVKVFALGLPHGHDLRTWWWFRKVLREFKPDVIHGHVIGLLQRYYLSLFCRELPIVSTCHGISDAESGIRPPNLRDRLDSISTLLLQLFSRHPRKIQTSHHHPITIFISDGVRQFKGAKGAPVIYNPMTFDESNAVKSTNILRTELDLPRSTKIIGTACRISLPKRPQLFTSVMCRVLREMPDVHAVVCGTTTDESLMSELKKIVIDSDVESRFHWLGYRPDAPALTKELDCFVMTSATEGMPTALLEAMSVKTPIAFMRGKGGLVDLDEFDKSEGPIAAVSDAGDVEGLSRQIVDLLDDPHRAHANATRAFACGQRHFDVNKIAQQLADVYHSVSLCKKMV